jgi:hypothetical protein
MRAASGPDQTPEREWHTLTDDVPGDAVLQHGLNVKKPMYYANSLPNQPSSN